MRRRAARSSKSQFPGEPTRRQTDIEPDGLAASNADGRRIGLEPVLPNFNAVWSLGQLDDELILALWRVPRFPIDQDVGVARTDAQQERPEV